MKRSFGWLFGVIATFALTWLSRMSACLDNVLGFELRLLWWILLFFIFFAGLWQGWGRARPTQTVSIETFTNLVKPIQIDFDQPSAVETVFLGGTSLAPGGFGADFTSNSLLAQYRPDLLHLPTTNGEHCTGDGIKMGDAWCFFICFCFFGGTWWWWWWSSQTRSDGFLAGLTCCRFLHSDATNIWLSSSYPQHVIGMYGGNFSLGCYTDLEIYSLGFFPRKILFTQRCRIDETCHAGKETWMKKMGHEWRNIYIYKYLFGKRRSNISQLYYASETLQKYMSH